MGYFFESVTNEVKLAGWEKGRLVPGYDSTVWRYDVCGSVIRFSDHGNCKSKYGWEIDHTRPRALGGSTTLDNLQPLLWSTNRNKADQYPWSCPIRR